MAKAGQSFPPESVERYISVIVSTSIGCEGLDAVDGDNILIRDTPAGFADVVNQLTAAVTNGTLPLARLDEAVGHVLSAKRVNLC